MTFVATTAAFFIAAQGPSRRDPDTWTMDRNNQATITPRTKVLPVHLRLGYGPVEIASVTGSSSSNAAQSHGAEYKAGVPVSRRCRVQPISKNRCIW
jgi:hypothetical protein